MPLPDDARCSLRGGLLCATPLKCSPQLCTRERRRYMEALTGQPNPDELIEAHP